MALTDWHLSADTDQYIYTPTTILLIDVRQGDLIVFKTTKSLFNNLSDLH